MSSSTASSVISIISMGSARLGADEEGAEDDGVGSCRGRLFEARFVVKGSSSLSEEIKI
jgi:hypothetical protein